MLNGNRDKRWAELDNTKEIMGAWEWVTNRGSLGWLAMVACILILLL